MIVHPKEEHREEAILVFHYFIEDEAECPNIALRCVGLALENFNRHIEGRPNNRIVLESLTIGLLREAEVANLDDSFV